jgi:hypothetical protein
MWRRAPVAVRRSAGLVRVKGEGASLAEGPTKTGKPRVVDIDEDTADVLHKHKKPRGSMALQLARDDALVFADAEGAYLHPERFSRTFGIALARCRREPRPPAASRRRPSGSTTCATRTPRCCCPRASRSRSSASGSGTARPLSP